MRYLFLFLLLLTHAACSCSEDGGKIQGDGSLPDGTVDGETPDGETPDGETPDGETPDGETPILCEDGEVQQAVTLCPDDNLVYACGNGCDDDGDGQLDLADSACTGPCDDDEAVALCPDGVTPQGPVTVCPADGFVYECGNGCDDDGVGGMDMADDNCAGDPCHVSESVSAGGGGQIVPCGGTVYRCGNGLDDDGDGLADSADPDCLGPCDNNETGFYPDIPGGGSGEGTCTLDCYFDDESGSGGDDCLWDVSCDPLEPGLNWNNKCAYDASTRTQGYTCSDLFDHQLESRPLCESKCEWRVPNGCDCFGCCLFPSTTDPDRHLFIGSKDLDGNKLCTLDDAKSDNPQYCFECTPVPSCQNECGECELCLGKDTLPEHCFPPPPPEDGGVSDAGVDAGDDASEPPPPRCEGGEQPCGLPGDDPCAAGFYCLTGCCVYFGGPG